MPDERKHRGPHPDDRRLFAATQLPALRSATSDLCWLLSRGYAPTSSTKIVGDRYALSARQRTAIGRCACSDEERRRRRERQVNASAIAGRELWIDGFNVLTSLEAALSAGVILVARDGCYRDMSSMHGSYRKVSETEAAITSLGRFLAATGVASCHWLLDRPVSNSGRLKAQLLEISQQQGWPWHVTLVADPDAELVEITEIVATADSRILDQAQRGWLNLAREAIEQYVPNAWLLNLAGDDA